MRKKLTHAQMKKLSALRPAGTVSISYRCGEDEIPVLLKTTLNLTDTSAFIDRVGVYGFCQTLFPVCGEADACNKLPA